MLPNAICVRQPAANHCRCIQDARRCLAPPKGRLRAREEAAFPHRPVPRPPPFPPSGPRSFRTSFRSRLLGRRQIQQSRDTLEGTSLKLDIATCIGSFFQKVLVSGIRQADSRKTTPSRSLRHFDESPLTGHKSQSDRNLYGTALGQFSAVLQPRQCATVPSWSIRHVLHLLHSPILPTPSRARRRQGRGPSLCREFR